MSHPNSTEHQGFGTDTSCLLIAKQNQCTVPLKCKLTVLSQNSILDPQSFRESRIEFRVLIFEVREPSLEDRVSSFETLEEFFEDLKQRFRGNDLILGNKTKAMNKAIDARLYLHILTRC